MENIEKDETAKALNQILRDAFKNNASDLHFEWLSSGMRIRYRVDGVLKEITPPASELQPQIIERIKTMASLDMTVSDRPQDGRIKMSIDEKELDLRVSGGPFITGESYVMRILSREKIDFDMENMGFTDKQLEQVRSWMKKPSGMIIVTGPTGAGKTTLMYSMISEMNKPEVKILTIENPIEYQIDGINQMQVYHHKGLTFAAGLRSQFRQDPDIIMVGEIRDRETLMVAAQASLTGQMVITSLHTMNAPSAVRRMLDIDLDPFLVNSVLTGVISKRLVRKVCDHCKEEYTPAAWITDLMPEYKGQKFVRGKGCDKCHHLGYKGRIPIHGLMEMNDELRTLISKDPDIKELEEKAAETGWVSIFEDGMRKAQEGLTTIEEIMRVIPPLNM